MYQPGFTYNPYPPSMMLEGQVPFSPAYYPHFGAPSPMHFAQPELGGADNSRYDPASAYMVPFAGYGGGGSLSGNQGGNALASSYPQTMGILGPYDHNASQVKPLFFFCLFC